LRTVERIEIEGPRDGVDHPLDRHHALRSTEAAERGVGHRVGLHPMRHDGRCGKVVRVIGVVHRAVVDRGGQVGGIPAARSQLDLVSPNPSVVVCDLIIGPEIVPLAGHAHVVVAIEPQLAGTPRHPGGKRGE
jgi:hypothetical protein